MINIDEILEGVKLAEAKDQEAKVKAKGEEIKKKNIEVLCGKYQNILYKECPLGESCYVYKTNPKLYRTPSYAEEFIFQFNFSCGLSVEKRISTDAEFKSFKLKIIPLVFLISKLNNKNYKNVSQIFPEDEIDKVKHLAEMQKYPVEISKQKFCDSYCLIINWKFGKSSLRFYNRLFVNDDLEETFAILGTLANEFVLLQAETDDEKYLITWN